MELPQFPIATTIFFIASCYYFLICVFVSCDGCEFPHSCYFNLNFSFTVSKFFDRLNLNKLNELK